MPTGIPKSGVNAGWFKSIPIVDRFWKYVRKGPGCWIWIGGTKGQRGMRYGRIRFKNRDIYAHRMSHELLIGKVPKGMWVLHRCDNPVCVNPKHLFLGNSSDNFKDMITKGRNAKGEKVYGHKLTIKKVKEIRKSQEMQKDLAKRFNVSTQTIYKIRIRETWKHI